MTATKHRISRLYAQIIACFICIVIFSVLVLSAASLWVSRKNEEHYIKQLQTGMDAISERIQVNVQSVYDLCEMVVSNALILENFKPYDRLTAANLYYYNSIIDLLQQSRLQFDSLVDSVFLYTDEKRVLYSANEKGMANLNTFFTSFLSYDQYTPDYWKSLLSRGRTRFFILPASAYHTMRVNDTRTVIPLVYLNASAGSNMVLVMNLSMGKLLDMYKEHQNNLDALLILYDDEGSVLQGEGPKRNLMENKTVVNWHGINYYVLKDEQSTLGITVFSLTPVSTFISSTLYFRITAIGLTAVYAIFSLALALFLSRRTYAPIREVGENIRNAQDIKTDSNNI